MVSEKNNVSGVCQEEVGITVCPLPKMGKALTWWEHANGLTSPATPGLHTHTVHTVHRHTQESRQIDFRYEKRCWQEQKKEWMHPSASQWGTHWLNYNCVSLNHKHFKILYNPLYIIWKLFYSRISQVTYSVICYSKYCQLGCKIHDNTTWGNCRWEIVNTPWEGLAVTRSKNPKMTNHLC